MKKELMISFLILFLNIPFSVSADTHFNFMEMFTKGNTHYRHNEYKDAIAIYEAILQGNKTSGALYYNLGNAYYRTGRVGKAVLNYERALRIIPRDSDLNYNYRFIQRKLPKYSDVHKGVLAKLMYKHIRFYSLEESGWIIFGLMVLGAFYSLLSLNLRWPFKRLRNGLIVAGMIITVYLLGAVFTVQYEMNRGIALETVSARFEPKENATTHFELVEGEEVEVLKGESQWSKIRRLDGKMGWIPSINIEEI